MTIQHILQALIANGGNKQKNANDMLHAMRVHSLLQIAEQNAENRKEKLSLFKSHFSIEAIEAKEAKEAKAKNVVEDLQSILTSLLNSVNSIQLTAQQKAQKYSNLPPT